MEIRKGIAVSPGYAIGEAFVLDTEEYRIPQKQIMAKEVEKEIERFQQATAQAIQELRHHIATFSQRVVPVAQKILEGYLTLLQDDVLQKDICDFIKKNRVTAEYAVSRVIQKKIKMIRDYGSDFFIQRAEQDLVEIEKTLLRTLLGTQREDLVHLTKSVILVAKDLSPAQTIALDKKKILGILTDVGGKTSHSAIIANSLDIPAIVGLGTISTEVTGGDILILDGTSGTVIINPDEGTLKRYQAMERNFYFLDKKLKETLKDLPAETRDGRRIELQANIELPEDVENAIAMGAEGIGLYRTEFLYLNHRYEPTEVDHISAYTKAISALGGRKLVIRTLDLGADKMSSDGVPTEVNPFLGTRAIRLCLQEMDLFQTQLRAIYKVSHLGNVSIMFPMVSSYQEVVQIKEIVENVKRELTHQRIAHNANAEIGIMVEVPSTALIADVLAPHLDFFSIGTNDLIAYTIAVDRLNERVAPLYQPGHPAILRLIKQVIEAGEKHHKKISLCGEMAGDVNFTILLVGLGLKVFSMAPHSIPEVKKVIRSITLEEARQAVNEVLKFSDAEEVTRYLREKTQELVPDLV